MRWRNPRRSDNVEQRSGIPAKAIGGGIGGLILLIIALAFGVNPGDVINGGTGSSSLDQGTPLSEEEKANLTDFVSIVLADTEDTWNQLFASENLGEYREPTLVIFSGAVDSACGYAESAVGPFYCPNDEKLYIDLSFYRDLKDKYGAPGDFAQAYVIAHEVGHHVQNQLGIMDQVANAQDRAGSNAEANRLSVKLELQADCLAGVWANNAEETRDVLEQGDVEEGINAAGSIGDDRLQMEYQGYVAPDTFTHGSSAQRTQWFNTGLETGDIYSCDTFGSS